MLAAAALVASESILNRYLEQGMLFVPLLRLSFMTVLGAAAGAAASVAMAAALELLRALGRRVVVLAVVAFGLGAAGLSTHAVVAWRKTLFPPATPWGIGRNTAALVALAVVTLGGLLFALRASDGLRATRPVDAPSEPKPRRLLRMAGAASLIVALALGVAIPWVATRRADGRPSVLMISIDTLRADRLGVLGNERGLTPNLDRLAKGGAVFLQATSTAPWTLPSHASVFTSMLPFDHHGQWYHAPIRPQRSMLAERFRNAGYRTAAFTGSAWMDGDRGFYQGFEVYEEHDELAAGGSAALVAAALSWIRGTKSRPYFLFFHTYEPHTPYLRTELVRGEGSGLLGTTFGTADLERLRSGTWELTPSEQSVVADLYDGDVANADRQIASLLGEAAESGGLDDTIVVVFSDHGEDLWDHEPTRSADHGHSLYEELLHVPLVFWSPARIRPGTRVTTPVSLLDVAPTVLALAGLPRDPQHRGQVLVGALATGKEPESRPIFAESVEYGPDRFSARVQDLKVIVTPFPERRHGDVPVQVSALEIFDLATDPHERLNLATNPNERALALASILTSRALEKLGAGRMAGQEPRLPERLRALGYIK